MSGFLEWLLGRLTTKPWDWRAERAQIRHVCKRNVMISLSPALSGKRVRERGSNAKTVATAIHR